MGRFEILWRRIEFSEKSKVYDILNYPPQFSLNPTITGLLCNWRHLPSKSFPPLQYLLSPSQLPSSFIQSLAAFSRQWRNSPGLPAASLTSCSSKNRCQIACRGSAMADTRGRRIFSPLAKEGREPTEMAPNPSRTGALLLPQKARRSYRMRIPIWRTERLIRHHYSRIWRLWWHCL